MTSTADLNSPQDYLESQCGYNFGEQSFYTVDQTLWLTFSVLTTSLVVPCIRDQSSYFGALKSLGMPGVSMPDFGVGFNVFHNYIPIATAFSQLSAIATALIGYYQQYRSGGFACFGLYTLALPFSVGILLPLTSFYVKAHKDKVPHSSHKAAIANTLIPIAFAAIGLPGVHKLLEAIGNMVSGLFKCCQGCCCCSSILSELRALNIDMYVSQGQKLITSGIGLVWGVISVCFLLGPLIVFIGSAIFVVGNAVLLTASIALTSFVLTMKVYPVLKAIASGGLGGLLQAGLWTSVQESLGMKEEEFDLSQSWFVYSPYVYAFTTASLMQLSVGTYWELGQYGSYSSQSVSMCGGFWLATYAPIFNNMSDTVDSLFKFDNLVGFAKMLSFVTTVIHCVNEAVVITLLKYLAIQQLGLVVTAGVGAAGVSAAAGTQGDDDSGADTGNGSAAYQEIPNTKKQDFRPGVRAGTGLSEPLV